MPNRAAAIDSVTMTTRPMPTTFDEGGRDVDPFHVSRTSVTRTTTSTRFRWPAAGAPLNANPGHCLHLN